MKVLTKDQLFDTQALAILRRMKELQVEYGDADGFLDEFSWNYRKDLGAIVYDLLVAYYGDLDEALRSLED